MSLDIMVKIAPGEKDVLLQQAFHGTYEDTCEFLENYARDPQFPSTLTNRGIFLNVGTCQMIVERLLLMKNMIDEGYYYILVSRILPIFMHSIGTDAVDYSFVRRYNVEGFCVFPPSICRQIIESTSIFDISTLKPAFEAVFLDEFNMDNYQRWLPQIGSSFEEFSGIIELCFAYIKEASENDSLLVTYINI